MQYIFIQPSQFQMEWSTPIDDEDGRLLDPTWVVDAKFPREMVDVRSEEGHIIVARKRRVFAFLFSLTISGHLIVWKVRIGVWAECFGLLDIIGN